MKFYLLYTALLLFAFFHFILCEDWTHSGGDNDEEKEEESKERKEARNFQIGISLPWVKTSRQHLPTIPKSLLVQVNIDLSYDCFHGTPYFCRVEVVKGMKIIGKLDYANQQCIIPGQFSLSSLNEQIQTVSSENELRDVPSSGEWPIFEVLLNPRRLKLNAGEVSLRRGEEGQQNGFLLPARPVLAQPSSAPPSPSAHRNRHPAPPPSSYLAYCRYRVSSSRYYYYPGVVVEEEQGQNGTLAFYHGLYSVQYHHVCSVFVVAVLNTRLPPPPPIDYRRRFNKLL